MTDSKPASKLRFADAKQSPPAAVVSAVALDARALRTALGSFATGVTIVTTQTADGRNVGLTCNSFASVSLNPPLVLWSLGNRSSNLAAFEAAAHFTVNVLSHAQANIALVFARAGDHKFVGIDWRAGLGGAPILAGCVASFQCRRAVRYDGGDHVIFLGAVEAFTQTPGAPLVFSRGKFGAFMADPPD